MANPQDWRRRAEPGPSSRSGGFSFRFRSDLRVLRESVEDGSRVNVRVVDPVNSKHYSFSEQEFFLCQQANGTNSLQAISAAYQQRFGQSFSTRDVRSFYRRLKIFGLIEPVSGAFEEAALRGDRRAPDGGGRHDEDLDDTLGDDAGPPPAWQAGGRARSGMGGGQGPGAARLLGGALPPDQDPGALLRALMQARAGEAGLGRSQKAEHSKSHSVWLCTPKMVFVFLYVLFYPIQFLYWLIWPGALLAGLTIFHNWSEFAAVVLRAKSSLSELSFMLVTLIGVNLVSRLAQGSVTLRLTGEAPRLGLILVFGVIPHFIVDTSGVKTLEKRGQLLIYATSLLTRLGTFVACTLLWALLRHSNSWVAEYAALVGQVALTYFLITACPLIVGDGLNWLSVKFGEPALKKKAMISLRAWFGGKPPPSQAIGLNKTFLVLFGIGLLLACAALAAQFLIWTAIALEAEFRGPGVLMFLCLFASFVAFLISIHIKTRRIPTGGGGLGFSTMNAGGVGALGLLRDREEVVPADDVGDETEDSEHRGAKIYSGARLFWSFVLVAVLAVAFLPYDYETGGTFRVLPAEHQSVAVRTDGEVTEIFVREGDWVEAGQVVAQLSPWDEERDLAVTQAELEKAKATLADLEAGPKPEQVSLAQRQVESARAGVAFSKAELDRADYLYKTGSGSLQALEKSRTTYEQNVANLNVAIANLDLVKSGATVPELEAARAEVRRLAHDTDYKRDQLERTRVRAPTAGRVITPNVHLLAGKYLTNGQPFLEVEDTRVVQVEIDVPETDIGEVQIGDEVRIKAWSYTDHIIAGAVTAIAPAVDTRDFGEVVRVNADIPNESGEIKTGMTGFAKIAGSEMPVWRAYLSLFVRFFRVEVWSWIP